VANMPGAVAEALDLPFEAWGE